MCEKKKSKYLRDVDLQLISQGRGASAVEDAIDERLGLVALIGGYLARLLI